MAAMFAAVLAWAGPPGTDLAAHIYQRTVFLDHGFTLWNNFWYAGRYSFVTYSLLYYPLAAALGIRLLAVATVATATLAFAVVVWKEWGPRARWSSRTFAVVWAGIVLSAAFPFALGAALALLGLWALQARRPWRFAALAGLTAAASPIAFLLLVLIVIGLALGRRADRWLQVAAGAGLLAVVLLEALVLRVFPPSGRYPFSVAELAAACTYCGLSTAFAWRAEGARTLRWVFPVYGVACLTFFFVSSGVGENIARLRYAAIPVSVLVLSLRNWRPLVPALVVFGLAISWNVTPLATSYVRAADDPASHAAYWQPAISYLRGPPDALLPRRGGRHRRPLGGAVPATCGDPARPWVVPPGRLPAERAALRPARPSLVRAVAAQHGRPVRAPDDGAPGLQRADRGGAGRVAGAHCSRLSIAPATSSSTRSLHATPIITGPGPARLSRMGESTIVATVARAGTYRIAVRFSRYWQTSAGCLRRARDGMISLTVQRPGPVRLRFSPTPGRALAALAGRPARSCAS